MASSPTIAGLSRARTRYPFEKLVGARFPLEEINEIVAPAAWVAGMGRVAGTALIPELLWHRLLGGSV